MQYRKFCRAASTWSSMHSQGGHYAWSRERMMVACLASAAASFFRWSSVSPPLQMTLGHMLDWEKFNSPRQKLALAYETAYLESIHQEYGVPPPNHYRHVAVRPPAAGFMTCPAHSAHGLLLLILAHPMVHARRAGISNGRQLHSCLPCP